MTSYLSFDPSNSTFDLAQPIFYQLPDPNVFGPGPYPVFIWTPGTYEVFTDALSLLFVTQMSQRGFLAVSVQYSNTETTQTCDQYSPRAQGVFDASRSSSAINVVCSLKGANCRKGVVTAGISQGGMLAALARNYAPSVQAAYALSVGNTNEAVVPFSLPCMSKQNLAIPAARLTVVNGQSDPAFGTQSNVQGVTGIVCPAGSLQCWHPSGSGAGWYLVQNSQVTDGMANHCYIDIGGCNDHFDPNWSTGPSNWSLPANLNWLASFGAQRVFSASGK